MGYAIYFWCCGIDVVSSVCAILHVMRQITKKDDQRLRQMLLRARIRVRHLNKPYWQAISFTPLRYKKRTS